MTDRRLRLRDAVNVQDEMERDKLLRRMRKLRAMAVLDKNTFEHWNRQHPDETPIDTSLWDKVIAYCDGDGPPPDEVLARLPKDCRDV